MDPPKVKYVLNLTMAEDIGTTPVSVPFFARTSSFFS